MYIISSYSPFPSKLFHQLQYLAARRKGVIKATCCIYFGLHTTAIYPIDIMDQTLLAILLLILLVIAAIARLSALISRRW